MTGCGCAPAGDRTVPRNVPGTAGTSAGTGAAGGEAGGGASGGASQICRSASSAPVVVRQNGDRLYEGLPCGDLLIFDVSNPQQPVQAGFFRAGGLIADLIIRGTIVLLLEEESPLLLGAPPGASPVRIVTTIRALDLADPGRIRELGNVPIPGRVDASRVVGDMLFVYAQQPASAETPSGISASVPYVVSIDMRDPDTITQAYALTLPQADLTQTAPLSSTDTRLFVGSWSASGTSLLQVVDISDPAGHLALAATVPTHASLEPSFVRLVQEKAGVLHIISQTHESIVLEDFDVVSSTNLVPRRSLDLTALHPLAAAYLDDSGGLAALNAANGTSGDVLDIVDLTDPAGLRAVAALPLDGLIMMRMDQAGQQLIATGTLFGATPPDRPAGSGDPISAVAVSLIDLSVPAAPRLQDQVEFGTAWAAPLGDYGQISVDRTDGSKILVVPYTDLPTADASIDQEQTHAQLVAWNGATLAAKGNFPIASGASVLTRDGLIYVITSTGIVVWNITDPVAPRQVSALTF